MSYPKDDERLICDTPTSSDRNIGSESESLFSINTYYTPQTPCGPGTSTRQDSPEPFPSSRDTVPVGAIAVWNDLPDQIKQDSTFANFQEDFAIQQSNNALTSDQTVPEIVVTKEASLSPFLSRRANDSKSKSKCVDEDDEADLPMSWVRRLTQIVLFLVWVFSITILMCSKEHPNDSDLHQLSVSHGKSKSFLISQNIVLQELKVELFGAFIPDDYESLSSRKLSVWIELRQSVKKLEKNNPMYMQNLSKVWEVPLVSEEMLDTVPEISVTKLFEFDEVDKEIFQNSEVRLQLQTDLNASFPVTLTVDLHPIRPEDGIIFAAFILFGLYILIMFEIVHRTIAAVFASTLSIAILAALNERPTAAELISWVDVETIVLLFCMMILVAIFAETGVFDYLAVYAYKVTNGKVWPLIITLSGFTALISSILDNVTTILLMTPVTIRLCEVTELNPVPILMAVLIYSNIGGGLTLVGDPPNVIIATNAKIVAAGVNFGSYILHAGTGCLIVMVVVHFHLRYIFRNTNDLRFSEPHDVQELRHEIAIWQRAAASLSSYSKDEDLVRETLMIKVRRLLGELKTKLLTGSSAIPNYKTNLQELQEKYPIRDRKLLIKSGFTLLFVITLFFCHSNFKLNLSLGWSALFGAALLFILAEKVDLEGVLARVEWSTLLFFTALFVLIGALSRLGLIEWIGHQTELFILGVDKESRLAVAIVLILWVSAIVSSFVDNIPLASMMVHIITGLSQNKELGLPLQPLVWALALGASFGGNGTLIGASSNMVCAGVAEQHGYRISFSEYLKIGYPVMLVSVVVSTIYLYIAHVIFAWH
nr:PREDICTED: P protein [Bemisia tabaci]XP_018914399.1 PREDICTED: P protein [Bemisia tabaci]XP_018914400.1 PREDICTED: P protein [Bemisia tabaci]